jgi:hypothetical protein
MSLETSGTGNVAQLFLRYQSSQYTVTDNPALPSSSVPPPLSAQSSREASVTFWIRFLHSPAINQREIALNQV